MKVWKKKNMGKRKRKQNYDVHFQDIPPMASQPLLVTDEIIPTPL
jgi:hypothetical protein